MQFVIVMTHYFLLPQTGLDLRITGFLVNGKYVWIGTGGGSVILFTVVRQMRSRTTQLQRKTLPYSAVAPKRRKRARSSLPGLLMQDPVGEAASVNPLTSTVEMERQTEALSPPLSPCTVARQRRAHTDMAPAENEEDANLYTLDFVSSLSVAKSTDHVRKLLAFE